MGYQLSESLWGNPPADLEWVHKNGEVLLVKTKSCVGLFTRRIKKKVVAVVGSIPEGEYFYLALIGGLDYQRRTMWIEWRVRQASLRY